MRPLVVGCAMVLVACSRHPSGGLATPSPAIEPPPAVLAAEANAEAHAPTAPEAGARLQLATGIEDTLDAGGLAPSLAGKTVLHVGDSMVGGNFGLTKALEGRFSGEGARFVRDYKVSESIVSFDHSPKLKELLAKHHPDIVLITLGTNDVFVPYPAAMAANARSIVGRVGARECYWIGPPTWKPDTGIVQVLRDNVAPCKFYDSSNLKLQRAGDGIHPTDRGGADWATSFWTYFRQAPASSGPTASDQGDASAATPAKAP